VRIDSVKAWWVHFVLGPEEGLVSDFGQVQAFDSMLVRVETDQGLTGWGEGKNSAGSAGTHAGLAALVNLEVGPAITGRDPRDITPIWDSLYNGVRAGLARSRGHVLPELARRGLSVAAISAIDIALWDILGKSLGVPLWRLFGGAKATAMPVYGSGGWAGPEEIGAQLRSYVDNYRVAGVKMRVGAMDKHVRHSADRIRAARAGLGPATELMCDAHGSLSPSEAKRLCKMVEDCDLTWFEEPVSADDKIGLAEVRRSTSIPLAAGESEYTRFDMRELIERRAVDVIQPDPAVCGGITECRRIDALASAHNLEFSPHLWVGAPGFAAGLHLAAASSASRWVEYPLGTNPMLTQIIEERFPIRDGLVEIPTAPGLGITVREDVVMEHAVKGAQP
jgi:L-alanine-DL-glutamate epimerase-like enolase superfamily enzyme